MSSGKAKEITAGGFEKEEDSIIQGSMPIGMGGIDRIEVPTTPTEIPGQNNPFLKFIEVYADDANAAPIYLVDKDAPNGVVPTDAKGGRPIQPGKGATYPLRGYNPSSSKEANARRPLFWYATGAGIFGIVTKGH